MCGIAGLMTTNGSPPPAGILERMGAAIAHRGPDGSGTYQRDDVGMIQVRLAIIDLATGDQPLYEPRGAALVANGEIYNYVELMDWMGAKNFATKSDCETPLHLYRRFGLDFVTWLRGMYAIALHDPDERQLILARDPFGIKPLYYVEALSGLAFASEPRALLAAGLTRGEVVPGVRDELLELQFTTGRDTIRAGIKRVLPGETLVVSKGRIVERRRIEALPSGAPEEVDDEQIIQDLDATLAGSVLVHQRSDVPYGMFLSGGIDSATVLALMARLNERPVKAFTIGFSSNDVTDERPIAAAIARSLGAEHVELGFNEADFWNTLPAAAAALDDPVADYAVGPTYRLGQAAREAGIKVVLSGEGGDELFAGYGRYRSVTRPWWAGGKSMRAKGTFDGLGVLRKEPANWRDGIVAAEERAAANGHSKLQAAQATDCADWLPNDLLNKLDRCLMAHGVEGRTPLLDREVAKLAFRLPDRLKIQDGKGKFLLRRWLQAQVPDADAMAPKQGFTVPVAEWIGKRAKRLAPLVARQECIQELCVPDSVEALFAKCPEQRAGFAAWTLLFYALWYRANVLGYRPETDVFSTLSARS